MSILAKRAWWDKTEPPKDRLIVAVGNLVQHFGEETSVHPFCGAIQFHKESGHWVDMRGMTIQTDETDEIEIHWWTDYPGGAD